MSWYYIKLNLKQAHDISNRPERFSAAFRLKAQYLLMLELYATERGTPERERLNAAYDRFVQYALKVTPDADVGDIDPDLAEFYCNVFKEEEGFKPRWHVSYHEAKAYCERKCERVEA